MRGVRVGRAVAVAGVMVAGIGSLAACSPGDPERPIGPSVTVPPATTTTTVETVEQQAFREAEATYRKHIALLDELARRPGDKALLKRLDDTSTGIEHDIERIQYGTKWVDRKLRLIRGGTVVRTVALTKALLDREPPELRLRTCIDGTDALVVDADGEPVRKGEGPFLYRESVTVVLGKDSAWRISDTTNDEVKSC